MPSNPSILGQRLKELRDRRDWSQADVANKSGVPAVMISHFETGSRQSASADTLVKLANAFHVSVDYLIGRSDAQQIAASPKVEAVLRKLETASDTTISAVLAVAESLTDGEKKKRDRR
jgi:transcriptional regulator with XRE-family HTH domain